MTDYYPDTEARVAELVALILAAGQGVRIGGPKLWLEFDGRTFLQTICERFSAAGLLRVIVVVAPQTRGLPVIVTTVVNEHPERGVLSSIVTGIQAAGEADGYLLMPVDHPYVQADTLRILAAEFAADPAKIIKPVYGGRGGHPVILPREFARGLTAKDVPGGLRALIARGKIPVKKVAVEDGGVLRNVNEAGDWIP